jgi:CheY-like chemotaxis protein
MKRILVIEDQPQMRRNLLTILEMEGYETAAAENGRVGLQLARSEKPDLILCDVMMPEMDGYAVLQTLHADPAFVTTPFIFLTAKGEKLDVRFVHDTLADRAAGDADPGA